MEYHIAEFPHTRETEIVHDNWVKESTLSLENGSTEKQLLCFWPPYKTPGKVMQALRLGAVPDQKTWTSHPIRILKSYDCYDKARNKLPAAELTSNLESSDQDIAFKKRKRKTNRRYIISDSDSSEGKESDSENIDGRVPFPPGFIRKHRKTSVLGVLQNTPLAGNSAERNSPPQNPNPTLPRQNTSSQDENQLSPAVGILPPQNRIVVSENRDSPSREKGNSSSREIEELSSTERRDSSSCSLSRKSCLNDAPSFSINSLDKEILFTLKNFLVPSVREILCHVRPVQQVLKADAPVIPIKNEEELNALEEYIKNQENYQYFVRRLSAVGGGSASQLTKRIMYSVIHDSYAVNFNWAGRMPKRSFQNLKIKDLIVDAVRYFTTNVDEKTIITAIQEHLKYAPSRVQKKKANTSIQQNNNNNNDEV